VLVLGASGWLGKTSLELLSQVEVPILAMASSEKTLNIQGKVVEIKVQNYEAIESFQPTIVIDCAFLTQNKLPSLGELSFVSINMKLIETAKRVQAIPSIRKFIAVSSGASQRYANSAISNVASDPYGALKLEYEKVLLESVDSPRKTVMLRPWNLSGPHCKDKTYALFDFIDQAKSGLIEVSSEHFVYRRYTAAEDLIFMGIASEPSEKPLDSGGEIVELEQLAHRIFGSLGISGRVRVKPNRKGENRYYAENNSFESAAAKFDFVPLSLEEQILRSL
jgi:nucleoside-diphosphate-sugar epimerase